MRIVPAARLLAKPTPISAEGRPISPAAIVCAALTLALAFLAFKIVCAL
jgi:hypothetical protein